MIMMILKDSIRDCKTILVKVIILGPTVYHVYNNDTYRRGPGG